MLFTFAWNPNLVLVLTLLVVIRWSLHGISLLLLIGLLYPRSSKWKGFLWKLIHHRWTGVQKMKEFCLFYFLVREVLLKVVGKVAMGAEKEVAMDMAVKVVVVVVGEVVDKAAVDLEKILHRKEVEAVMVVVLVVQVVMSHQ